MSDESSRETSDSDTRKKYFFLFLYLLGGVVTGSLLVNYWYGDFSLGEYYSSVEFCSREGMVFDMTAEEFWFSQRFPDQALVQSNNHTVVVSFVNDGLICCNFMRLPNSSSFDGLYKCFPQRVVFADFR